MRAFLALAICAGLQAATTTITQTRIAAGDGKHLATGTITITATAAFVAADGVRVETTEFNVPVVNGAFTVSLEPNDTGIPSGTQYTAVWQLTGAKLRRDLWMVPTTASVLTVRDVVVSTATPAGTIIQWQQMGRNGAAVGQGPVWTGSSWAPGYSGGPQTWGQLLIGGTTWGQLGGN